MGFVGATVNLEVVKKKMARSRTYLKNESNRKKVQMFCADASAFNWVCRCYRYLYWMNNGNMESINSETYGDYYDMIAGSQYKYLLEDLKNGYEYVPKNNAEAKYLLDGLKKLRKIYK